MRWRSRVYVGAGVVIAVLFVYALVSSIPNRTAVRLEGRGKTYLLAGRYVPAEHDFAGVLRHEPLSTDARFGLACAFFLTGHRGRALLELNLALKNGLVLDRAGSCGHRLVFSLGLFVAKFGLTDSFVAPKGAPGYQHQLESVPADNRTDTAHRLLMGACLAFRARLDGVGWYYAANAHDQGQITDASVRDFFRCLGSKTLARLGCRRSLNSCVFNGRNLAAYLKDRPYLYPVDQPRALTP